MNKWFNAVNSIEELRRQYKALLKLHHPDNGGIVSDMQEINAEYDALYARLNRKNTEGEQGYAHEKNEHFKAVMNEIIGFNMTVEIIGSWIWCFDCYPYKDHLKALGFTWCSKKKAWAWHLEPYHKHHKREIPLSQIKAKYGCQTVRSQQEQYSLK